MNIIINTIKEEESQSKNATPRNTNNLTPKSNKNITPRSKKKSNVVSRLIEEERLSSNRSSVDS